MRDVGAVDSRYRSMIDGMFEEVAAKVPGFEARSHQESILISSPDAQVYYHADLPGQGLIQIAGRKRVYVYPNTPPFITPQHLEDIAVYNVEVDIPYAALVRQARQGVRYRARPDAELGAERAAPRGKSRHLQRFDDRLLHQRPDPAREIVNLANGLLRHRFGYRPKTRNLRGPSYFAKAVMQKLYRDSGWVKREREARRPIDFRLDAAQPGKIVDLPKAA